jgi:hypothetical protein
MAPDLKAVWRELLGYQPPGLHGPADIPVLRLLVEAEFRRRQLAADLVKAQHDAAYAPTIEERREGRVRVKAVAHDQRAQEVHVSRLLITCRMTPSSRMDRSMPARMVAQDAGRATAVIEGEAEGAPDWRRVMGGSA